MPYTTARVEKKKVHSIRSGRKIAGDGDGTDTQTKSI